VFLPPPTRWAASRRAASDSCSAFLSVKLSRLQPLIPMQAGPALGTLSPAWTDTRRGTRQERGYGAAWDRLRLTILKRDRYLCTCAPCTQKGLIRPATEVDHRISKAAWKIRNGTLAGVDDPSNLGAINAECHRIKTAAEQREAFK
jgi:hypothetical protein